MIYVSCIPFYIHVQLAVMLSFHVVQHAQIEKCTPRRFCIKQDVADFNHRIVLSDKFRNLRFRDTMNLVVPETFLFKGGCGGSAVFLFRS